MATVDLPSPALLDPGDHPCWVVEDDATYVDVAHNLLKEGRRLHQKNTVFGPAGSVPLVELGRTADLAADPLTDFLGGKQLVPEAMFAAFRAETDRARDAGYAGLRVVADMDWLVPLEPSAEEIVAFEAQLDRVVRELEASVVCAYRPKSFPSPGAIGALACVHPAHWGPSAPPFFRLEATGNESWALSGEIDFAGREAFASAFDAVVGKGPCVVDMRDVEFIDVAGMRTIARSAMNRGSPLVLRGSRPILQRAWRLAGFDGLAPAVQFAG